MHAAAVDLLTEGSLDISIADVARRANVNPTSVYRRWGNREWLIMDAAITRLLETSPIPDTGSLRGDLTTWADAVEEQISRPDGQVLLRALIATLPGDCDAAETRLEFLERRLADLQTLLDRAAARGERPPTAHRVVEAVIAPLYMNVLFGLSTPRGYGRDLVGRLLGDAQ